MKNTVRYLFSVILLMLSLCSNAQDGKSWDKPGNGNPFIPGYFADPTIRKFGDTYYIYATTDGTGNGYGPAQVWMSKDFVNWRNVVMNWPTTEVVWAPEVVQTSEGKYRYYYCEPCMVHVGESDSPVGPWKNMLGAADAVLMPDRYCDPMAITLDPQVFTDDDGSQYLFVGTWGIYEHSGCGWAKLAKDGKSFTDKGLVPNTQIKDFFEAPFVFKKDGKYYFTYSSGSCHDDTYRVQYAVSETGPTGPYTYKGCILKTNADGTIHGPGHHSVLVDEGRYYMVYHRHNNPHAIHGFNRQLCIDEMEFDKDGNILPLHPTHEGVIPVSLTKGKRQKTLPNLAYQCKVTASSELGSDFRAEYAVDDHNGTLWRAKNNQGEAWLQIDLGKEMNFNQVWLQFEYATFFYQYKIETSLDGQEWKMYADKTQNTEAGSPLIEKGETKARYLRITITNTQKNGHFAALWNVKVYKASKKNDPSTQLPSVDGMDYEAVNRGYPRLHQKDVERERKQFKNGLVVDINADDYARGKVVTTQRVKNRTGAGDFVSRDDLSVEIVKKKYAFYFDGKQRLESTFPCPANFTYNSAYTISAWVLNPSVEPIECIASVTPQRGDLTRFQFNQGKDKETGLVNHAGSFESAGFPRQMLDGEGQWQHWTVSYDGWMNRFYLNGKLVGEKNNFLMLRPGGPIFIGADEGGADGFSGYIHSLRLYDRGLSESEVLEDYNSNSETDDVIAFDADNLDLKVEMLSPSLVQMEVTDKQGDALHSGQLSYAFGVASDNEEPEMMAFSNRSKVIVTVEEAKKLKCKVTVKTVEGVSRSITKELVTNVVQCQIFKDDFSQERKWDGRYLANESVTYQRDGGMLKLTSARTNFNADASQNGAMIYKEVKGDFLMQVKVADFMGSERQQTPGYNEGGLLVILPQGEHSQQLVQLGVFPAYNCGNMLTTVNRNMRPQYPNQQGWNYDPYLQLQRKGNLIHARTSRDGKTWVEMPASPVDVTQFGDATMRVGLFQTTYSDARAWVGFRDFILYSSK